MSEPRPPMPSPFRLVATAAVAGHVLLHGPDFGPSRLLGTVLGAALVLGYMNGRKAGERELQPGPAPGGPALLPAGATILVGLFCAMPGGLALLVAVGYFGYWLNTLTKTPRVGGYAELEAKIAALATGRPTAPTPEPEQTPEPVRKPKPEPARKPEPVRETPAATPEALTATIEQPMPEIRPFEVPSSQALEPLAPTLEPLTSALGSRLDALSGRAAEGLASSSATSGFEEALAMLQGKPKP